MDKNRNMAALTNLIKVWADERNLLGPENTSKQFMKLSEEQGELSGAIARDDKEKIKDSLGDTFVVLTILAEKLGFSLVDCVNYAYEQIKDRKGEMHDGVFIKQEDL